MTTGRSFLRPTGTWEQKCQLTGSIRWVFVEVDQSQLSADRPIGCFLDKLKPGTDGPIETHFSKLINLLIAVELFLSIFCCLMTLYRATSSNWLFKIKLIRESKCSPSNACIPEAIQLIITHPDHRFERNNKLSSFMRNKKLIKRG